MNSESSDPSSAFWDTRYSTPGEAFGTAPNVFLASKAALFKRGQRVLVPGDGEGRNGVWLAEQGLVVDTVDASVKGVANAHKLAAARGVAINAQVADLTDWSWPVGVYDVVVSIFLHFKESVPGVRAGMHGRMLAALKPGGLVVLEAYGPGQAAHQKAGSVGGPQTADGLLSVTELKSHFAAAEIVELSDAETVLSEGVRHRGPSSVVRMIARKRG